MNKPTQHLQIEIRRTLTVILVHRRYLFIPLSIRNEIWKGTHAGEQAKTFPPIKAWTRRATGYKSDTGQ